MIDLDEYTANVASYAADLCVNFTFEERVEMFGCGVIREIFRTYTVTHIRTVLWDARREMAVEEGKE